MPKVSEEHLERRRKQILEAAIGCFARQGFHATSMQDIFAAAGLSAGAVYRYFPSKTELIRAIAAEALASVLPALDSELRRGATPSLPDAMAAVLAPMGEGRLARLRPVIVQVWAEAARDEELAGFVRSVLGQILSKLDRLMRQLVTEGRMPPGTDTGAVARMILATLQGYLIQFDIFGAVSPEEVRAAATAILVSTDPAP